MVLYGFLEVSKSAIGVAKMAVRFSFSCPVSHFCRNFEASFMVLYGFLEISKTAIGDAKIRVRFSAFSCFRSPMNSYYFSSVLETEKDSIGGFTIEKLGDITLLIFG